MKYELVLPVIEVEGYPPVIRIDMSSSLKLKQSLATIARYFKKEFEYDHLQYDEHDEDPDCVGVLICERAMDQVKHESHYPSYVLGGACFRKDSFGNYFLDWIWIHPFARNRGKLKQLWPQFRIEFGKFFLSPPLSAQMAAFIAKHP